MKARGLISHGFAVLLALGALALLLIERSGVEARWAWALRSLDIVLFLALGVDALLRWRAEPGRLGDLRGNWVELAALPALTLLLLPFHFPLLDVLFREAAIAVVLIGRARRSQELLAQLRLKPAFIMLPAFLLLIGFGAPWLMLPQAAADGRPTGLLDALFTATSAVCVTGLTVKDTALHFGGLGQAVILILVQLGGLGIMTFSATLLILLRRPVNILQQAALQEVLDHDTLSGIRRMVWFIVLMTFSAELVGAGLLAVVWRARFDSLPATLWHALFHAVSAFCNAGFSTFSDSLCRFRGDVSTQAILMALIVLGGLGFVVVKDLRDLAVNRLFRPERRTLPLRVQSRLVLVVTFFLIVAGAAALYAIESGRSLAGLPLKERILAALFHAVSGRTAGFNTVDLAQWSGGALLVVMVLMFIGGSPGSTAGGIKTTTAAILWGTVLSELRRRDRPEIYRRTIPVEVIRKAVSLLVLSLLVVGLFTSLLLCTQPARFLDVLFECVSAFGTTGLSLGITPEQTPAGKALLTALMFIGRLGTLTLAYAFVRHGRPARYAYAEERIMIG